MKGEKETDVRGGKRSLNDREEMGSPGEYPLRERNPKSKRTGERLRHDVGSGQNKALRE